MQPDRLPALHRRGLAYYVSNRSELVCVRLADFRPDSQQSPVRWRLDMAGQLGVYARAADDVANPRCSPIVVGDQVYCVTGNGANPAGANVVAGVAHLPRPDAPSFLAVAKETGEVRWSSNLPGPNLQYGQWSSPAELRVGKRTEILFPGGDGWLYALDATSGRLRWNVDCNLPDAIPWLPRRRGTRTAFMTAPTVGPRRIYIGTAIDRETTGTRCPIYAFSRDDQARAERGGPDWVYWEEEFGGTCSELALGAGGLYALGRDGMLVCLDPDSPCFPWPRRPDSTVLTYLEYDQSGSHLGGALRIISMGPPTRGTTMRAYSNDLRERIVAAVARGEHSLRQLARLFAVSLSCIVRLLQRFRRTGSIGPKPHARGPPASSPPATRRACSPWSASSPTPPSTSCATASASPAPS